ncbi:peptidase M50 [Halosimplex carlsbadense 2-9-1]|uniref:Zinc metalloprotease n=1 Tax=Halosimplex carlsbadense 2-9-1 TaxID=797114 RepID=M0CIQ4_9EURY|nr:site-2 protease family protein [Halosimplex carlsbadense]ELZ22252.1 peptidase M50 [Halosimplex carlsbadense 2-9-1]
MRDFTVGSVWGIPIRINVSLVVFLPILAWIIGSGAQIDVYAGIVNTFSPTQFDVATLTAGSTPWVIGAGAAVGLFASVGVHELGHAWAARRYGIGTQSITLWLLGGIAALEEMPREWNREFWIAIAGPITSVLTGVACYALLLAVPGSAPVVGFVFGWLVVTNVLLAVFNLLPAFPMDGGRVLRALLARTRPYEAATATAARFGTGFAVLFAVVGVLSFAPMLLLLALFIYGAASSESRSVMLQGLLTGLTLRDVARLDAESIDADESVSAFTDRMIRDRRTVYPVVDAGETVGVVTLDAVRRTDRNAHDTTRVREIMVDDLPRVPIDTPAFDAFVELGTHSSGYALVEDGGEVVGLLSSEDFAHVLQFRRDGVEMGPREAF